MPHWAIAVLSAGVPLTVWVCLWQHWPLWIVGALLLPLALTRSRGRLGAPVVGIGGALLGIAALTAHSELPVRFYPVLVSAGGLSLFLASLRHPPTVIERIARLRDPDLTPQAVTYTRRVTVAWCLFFTANGAIALYTAVASSQRIWAIYNGLIAYVLMGLMFAGEYLIRRRVIRSAHVT